MKQLSPRLVRPNVALRRRLGVGALALTAVAGSLAMTSPATAGGSESAAATTVGQPPVVHLGQYWLSQYQRDTSFSVKVGTTWRFDGSGSYDPEDGRGSLQFFWSSDDDNSVSDQAFYDKTFDTVGWVKVSLKVTDTDGNSTTGFGYVRVTEGSNGANVSLAPPQDQVVPLGTTLSWDQIAKYEFGWSISYWWASDEPMKRTWVEEFEWGKRFGFTKTFDQPGTVHMHVQPSGFDSGAAAAASVKVSVAKPDGQYLPEANLSPVGDQWAWLGDTVTFDASGSSDLDGGPLTYRWTDDGSPVSSTGTTFAKTFDALGWHTVSVQVTDPQGNAVTETRRVLVRPVQHPPVAKFVPSGDPTVTSGSTVTFDGTLSTDEDNQELTYEWTTDDSTKKSTEPTFTKKFRALGPVKVTLKVTDPDGLVSETSTTVNVVKNEPPVADFAGPTTVTEGETASFDGSSSSDPNNDPLTYEWFTSGVAGPIGTKATLDYQFPKAGAYGLELRVKDPLGATAKKWVRVTVLKTNQAPTADFSVPTNITSGTAVKFDGSASTDPNGDPLTYEWRVRYAKGVVSTAPVLNYTFPRAGKYGVQLTVKDPSGASHSKWVEVTVTSTNKAPVANFGAPSTITAGVPATFDGSISSDPDGDALTYAWYVRGERGVVSTDPALTYTFAKAGNYGVELRVTDPSGATAKKWMGVTAR